MHLSTFRGNIRTLHAVYLKKHLNLISTKYQLLAEIYVIPFVRRQVFEQSQGMIV